MASATLSQPQDLGLQNLNIVDDAEDDESETLERKRPAVAKLTLPASIVDVARDNFLYWNLSDLIDETPEGAEVQIELPTQNELALEIAGVGLKIVKDRADPENEDYVPADRETKINALATLRKLLVVHEDNPVWDRTPQAEWEGLINEVVSNIDKAAVIVRGWIKDGGDLAPKPIPGSEGVDLYAEPVYIDENRKVLFDAKPAQVERCAALIYNYLAFHERGIAALVAQEEERRSKLPGVVWKKTHDPLRVTLPAVLKGRIDAEEFPLVAAAVDQGYLEGPYELKMSRTVSSAAFKLGKEKLSREEKAATQLLYLIGDRLLVSDKFWNKPEAEVLATPAEITAAYEKVVKDLNAVPASERLKPRDDADASLEAELWNMVCDAEKGEYDD